MPGNSARRPNQPASGPALGSIWLGIMGPMDMSSWEDGPKYRGTLTPTSSRKTCFDGEEPDGVFAPGMIPSPLGRGLPSRHGYGKSF
jgi:hypothetical protein